MIALQDNPPMTCPAGCSVGRISGKWWVAHTRARHEKSLAHDLLVQGTSYFLPMVQRTLIIRKRRFRSLIPLFPGYLFFAGDETDRYRALCTSHVANIIPVVDQGRFVDELAQIEKALATPAGLDPFPYLQRGTPCRIIAGPLAGVHGVVERRDGITRLILRVEMLGQAVATEIDPSLLEVVS
jgi:transcription antitermination factor NusG